VRSQALQEFSEDCQSVADNPQDRKPTFIDYLRAGWELSLSVAIDYTASNGDPSQSDSLHFLGPNN